MPAWSDSEITRQRFIKDGIASGMSDVKCVETETVWLPIWFMTTVLRFTWGNLACVLRHSCGADIGFLNACRKFTVPWSYSWCSSFSVHIHLGSVNRLLHILLYICVYGCMSMCVCILTRLFLQDASMDFQADFLREGYSDSTACSTNGTYAIHLLWQKKTFCSHWDLLQMELYLFTTSGKKSIYKLNGQCESVIV